MYQDYFCYQWIWYLGFLCLWCMSFIKFVWVTNATTTKNKCAKMIFLWIKICSSYICAIRLILLLLFKLNFHYISHNVILLTKNILFCPFCVCSKLNFIKLFQNWSTSMERGLLEMLSWNSYGWVSVMMFCFFSSP
jgi:hypothetical protein